MIIIFESLSLVPRCGSETTQGAGQATQKIRSKIVFVGRATHAAACVNPLVRAKTQRKFACTLTAL